LINCEKTMVFPEKAMVFPEKAMVFYLLYNTCCGYNLFKPYKLVKSAYIFTSNYEIIQFNELVNNGYKP